MSRPILVVLALVGLAVASPHGGSWGDHHDDYHRDSREESGGTTARTCADSRLLDNDKIKEIKSKLAGIIFDDRIAHAVRIAFHDCVDGCDGCINVSNPDNNGPMLQTLAKLDRLYDRKGYSKNLSRADFYALAGIYALEQGVINANAGRSSGARPTSLPDLGFNYCRADCASSPQTNDIRGFPGGHDNYTQVMDFFRRQFDLDERLSTALLGAHTLGGAAGNPASGFVGFWKENAVEAAKFDNRYYVLMRDRNIQWQQVDVSGQTGATSPRWQWNGFRGNTQVSFMLQADVALYRQVQTDASGRSACEPYLTSCTRSPTNRLVDLYAFDEQRWLNDFAVAFKKMIESGRNNQGRLVRAS